MYFVTTNRAGYVLFCMTPSERAAVGLTDKQAAHLLVREPEGGDWRVLREWNASDYSLTDFLAALHHVEEPADPRGLLDFLPGKVKRKT